MLASASTPSPFPERPPRVVPDPVAAQITCECASAVLPQIRVDRKQRRPRLIVPPINYSRREHCQAVTVAFVNPAGRGASVYLAMNSSSPRLSALTRDGKIRRVRRGLYDRPNVNPSPPALPDYCPDEAVTRAEMAVFMMAGLFNQFLPAGTPLVAGISPSTLGAGTSGTFTITGANTNFVQGTTTLSPM